MSAPSFYRLSFPAPISSAMRPSPARSSSSRETSTRRSLSSSTLLPTSPLSASTARLSTSPGMPGVLGGVRLSTARRRLRFRSSQDGNTRTRYQSSRWITTILAGPSPTKSIRPIQRSRTPTARVLGSSMRTITTSTKATFSGEESSNQTAMKLASTSQSLAAVRFDPLPLSHVSG
jgi:hypothetical protein